jgi:hypothetical protein
MVTMLPLHSEDLGLIEPIASAADHPPPPPPASMDPSDYLSPIREEALRLLNPDRDRARLMYLAAGALVAGFGLGWAGGWSWHRPHTAGASEPIAQREPSSRRPETRSASKIDAVRKHASLGSGANKIPRAQVTPSEAQNDADSLKTASLPTTASPGGTSTAIREPMVAAPETRPTTIPGWSVVDVRGSTAVLEGPDGVKMAAAGDTVPGIGRIDSVVRWGNRWIVATASGLIATP